MSNDSENAIEMRGITKRFGELSANNNIDFKLKKGEIHALLGENGAGKTTLMNILSGMYHPDGGEIFVTGKKVRIHSPHESLMLGIGMVYQHLTLVPTLSVLENIFLGTTSLLYRIIFGSEFPVVPDITGKTAIPLLSRVPYITSIFNQHLITYISWVLLPIAWWVLYKTNFGLRVRAVGESPVAADAHGVNVYRTRYMTLIIEGVLAGLAGAFLSICVLARNTRLPGAFCQPYERE